MENSEHAPLRGLVCTTKDALGRQMLPGNVPNPDPDKYEVVFLSSPFQPEKLFHIVWFVYEDENSDNETDPQLEVFYGFGTFDDAVDAVQTLKDLRYEDLEPGSIAMKIRSRWWPMSYIFLPWLTEHTRLVSVNLTTVRCVV